MLLSNFSSYPGTSSPLCMWYNDKGMSCFALIIQRKNAYAIKIMLGL